MYKLIIFDIDGTLVKKRGIYTKALHKLHDAVSM